ncbi:MAG: CoA pyrophosphatase [Peptoniphilaceae bacterium]|nr:CoA pyrophosphatase [Peptoniphilaceae bacterium]MDY6019498.1 CoA pyrophosphatase [Anaerococcus sp.]
MKNIQVDDKFYNKIRKYAVFIPIIKVDGKNHILFEVRSSIVAQPGEVSFPGGSLEENEDFKMAAIRETREELNLHEKDIDFLGYSSMTMTRNNRHIKAFYGRLNKSLEEISYNMEVEKLFTVDINYLLKNPPQRYKAEYKMIFPDDFPFEKIPGGEEYNFYPLYHYMYFYDTKPVIWGLTAELLKDFMENITTNKIIL